jgi:hypothetical protein
MRRAMSALIALPLERINLFVETPNNKTGVPNAARQFQNNWQTQLAAHTQA